LSGTRLSSSCCLTTPEILPGCPTNFLYKFRKVPAFNAPRITHASLIASFMIAEEKRISRTPQRSICTADRYAEFTAKKSVPRIRRKDFRMHVAVGGNDLMIGARQLYPSFSLMMARIIVLKLIL
jgi:hypothetical protein